ncbi:MAG: acetolactate synthase large subunit [Bryobacteraceae bacterium]|nr:acetolactate synthase large subunit [Bryobacteraceae bacterium]
MQGAEVLLRTLVASDVTVCFMNPGTSEMQFVAALDRVPGMRPILCLYEGVCSGAADGYARMLGKPASTLLHLGPGLANALSNFHNARKAGSPVVSIVGEHSTYHLNYDAPLTSDIHAFAATVSTHVFQPETALEIGESTVEAISASRIPPGHVAQLIVPADLSWSEAGDPDRIDCTLHRLPPDRKKVSEVAKLLQQGRKVSFVLGGTALLEKGLTASGALAALHKVRVFANRNSGRLESGRGRFQPQRIAYFPEPAEAMLGGTEHLVLVESAAPVSFFGYPESRSYLAPDDAEVHTLTTPAEDGASALAQLAALTGASPAPLVLPAPLELRTLTDAPLTADLMGQIVSAMLPEDAIVSDESISCSEPVFQHLLRAKNHTYLPVTGGSIGQGLPVALGAAVACPNRKVVALEADGSAMYTLQALWTMAREQLDVTTVIFNNRRYRILDVEMQRTGAKGFGPAAEDMIALERPDLDFVKLSQGLGVAAVRSTNAGQFAEAFADAMNRKGPYLIEAIL